jgi:hypothetical protein
MSIVDINHLCELCGSIVDGRWNLSSMDPALTFLVEGQ